MVMPNTARRYTATEVLAFPPDRNRYEVVHGELLVTPSPGQPHQIVLRDLFRLLDEYLRAFPQDAHVFFAPADIIWSDEDYVQPDLFVVPANEVTGSWRDCRTLLLAVEIVSPSSARADRVTKRRLYQERGVGTYWVVDPAAGLVEVWKTEDERPVVVTETLSWRLKPAVPELSIVLRELFGALPAGSRPY
jgi:Uma2 family endonuclease